MFQSRSGQWRFVTASTVTENTQLMWQFQKPLYISPEILTCLQLAYHQQLKYWCASAILPGFTVFPSRDPRSIIINSHSVSKESFVCLLLSLQGIRATHSYLHNRHPKEEAGDVQRTLTLVSKAVGCRHSMREVSGRCRRSLVSNHSQALFSVPLLCPGHCGAQASSQRLLGQGWPCDPLWPGRCLLLGLSICLLPFSIPHLFQVCP